MNAPEVRLHPNAARWVAERGGTLTLRSSPRNGCCGGTAHLTVAEPGRPEDPADWEVRTVDGVTVYLDPALAGQAGPFTVRAEGLLGWRRLFVELSASGEA
ncbi:CC/Se motif family (seleno)protein [Thiohalorhabdus methylotrophus]|uniref:CC/Se motif family (Seleno)protein n=1 Tax=Thiohalorhabdus methylotrophus TaxID=3242694 RepID=A0ABV4TUL1_9GAMM